MGDTQHLTFTYSLRGEGEKMKLLMCYLTRDMPNPCHELHGATSDTEPCFGVPRIWIWNIRGFGRVKGCGVVCFNMGRVVNEEAPAFDWAGVPLPITEALVTVNILLDHL